jgi:hypothetical protein
VKTGWSESGKIFLGILWLKKSLIRVVVMISACGCLSSLMSTTQSKTIPTTSLGDLLGCETSRIPYFLENLLTDGGDFSK